MANSVVEDQVLTPEQCVQLDGLFELLWPLIIEVPENTIENAK